jgi:LPXTG-motif cell wall-anchored protein
MRFLVGFSLSCLSVLSLTTSASAHVDLTYPPPRALGSANGDEIKIGPCGQGTNGRTATVTTFTPGQMVDVKIEEYVDHTGYYAVSFDNDGDNDFPFPRANSDDVVPATDDPMAVMPIGDKILGYHLDKTMNCADNPNDECIIKVQIPNVNCQNCTLQVVQFMYDKTDDNQPNEHYYQCADIKIEGALMPGGGAGGMGGTGGAAGGSGGTGGGAGGVGGASGGTPTGGMPGAGTGGAALPMGGSPTGGTGTAGTTTTTTPPAEESSCTIAGPASTQRSSLAAAAGALLLGLGFLARRRKRAG